MIRIAIFRAIKPYFFLLFFAFPAFFVFIMLFASTGKLLLFQFLENTVFSFLFALLCLNFKKLKTRANFLKASYWFVTIIIGSEYFYYFLYGFNISLSTIYILLETHRGEASEYISSSLNSVLLLSIFYLIAQAAVFHRFISKSKSIYEIQNRKLWGSVCIGLICILTFTPLANENLPIIVMRSIYSYSKQSSDLDKLTKNKMGGDFGNITYTGLDSLTCIVIIGESATREHHSLYSYNRLTNLHLENIRSELKLFDNVIAPNTNTIQSLSKVLTTFDASNRTTTGTIMQLFNRAGFKTFWLSNQVSSGSFESVVAKIAKTATVSTFINNETDSCFDQKLIPNIEQALNDPAKRKVIFVHLMGSHADYKKRYPASINRFNDRTIRKKLTPKNSETLNAYDNSIAYTDILVRQSIELLRTTYANGYLLYFSDHGEDVFETGEMAYHKENYGTKPMYDIPFILWMTTPYERFIESRNVVIKTNRAFMTDKMTPSLARISGIEYDKFVPENCLFDAKYEAKPRIIYDNLTYEDRFKVGASEIQK